MIEKGALKVKNQEQDIEINDTDTQQSVRVYLIQPNNAKSASIYIAYSNKNEHSTWCFLYRSL